jgi:hypothetical protein
MDFTVPAIFNKNRKSGAEINGKWLLDLKPEKSDTLWK